MPNSHSLVRECIWIRLLLLSHPSACPRRRWLWVRQAPGNAATQYNSARGEPRADDGLGLRPEDTATLVSLPPAGGSVWAAVAMMLQWKDDVVGPLAPSEGGMVPKWPIIWPPPRPTALLVCGQSGLSHFCWWDANNVRPGHSSVPARDDGKI